MSAGDGRRQLWAEWISVKDHLPPCAATVLVCVRVKDKCVRLRAFYVPVFCKFTQSAGHGWFEEGLYNGQSEILHQVTHWMELPPAPEGA